MTILLKVSDLQVHFQTPGGTVKANNGVDLEVVRGSATGIMGESGCGKTVLFLSILRLQQPGRIVSGSIWYDGTDIARVPEKEMYAIRGRQIGFIPQNQATALNPSYTVEQHLGEIIGLRDRGPGLWENLFTGGKIRPGHRERVEKLLGDLGLGDSKQIGTLLKSYPHQLSGGMRQRVMTAMALLLRPRLLIADEPTTALDRANRSLALKILKEVKQQATLLLVSHDIETITGICDRVAVMYGGRVIECGPAAGLLTGPLHPYTRLLLSCRKTGREMSLPELFVDSQDLINLPEGCSFHPFCPEARPVCSKILPGEVHVGPAVVSCHRYCEAVQC